MAWRIGVDIGGTFTDVALVDEAGGRIGVVKVLTTPGDFSRAVVAGLTQRSRARSAIDPAEVALLAHATTVVTNALLEKKGARAGLVTTRGFRDVLELRRSSRADLYDLFQDAPDMLVPRRWRFEITERIDAQGEIVTPLAEDEIDGAGRGDPRRRIETRRGVAAVLVPQRRARAPPRRAAARRACPGSRVYLSCESPAGDPRVRAHQHDAVCAYVGPLLAAYLDRLQRAASRARPAAALRDGVERRRVRCRRGAAHAGDGGRERPGRRRRRGAAGRARSSASPT